MTTIPAQSILASVNKNTGDRVDTILCRFPRWILPEVLTHRVFSRNTSSSRAIPTSKLIDEARNDPAEPIVWTENEPGMQGRKELGGEKLMKAVDAWRYSCGCAISQAEKLEKAGAHKQIVNRILEPFIHTTMVISATSWDGFFEQRIHVDAEPHMQMLALSIFNARRNAELQWLEPGEWHLPFVTQEERNDLTNEAAVKVSVARCASTSYKTVDGLDMTIERAVALHDKLLKSRPIHASPAEHACYADKMWLGGYVEGSRNRNFDGFVQYRALIETNVREDKNVA